VAEGFYVSASPQLPFLFFWEERVGTCGIVVYLMGVRGNERGWLGVLGGWVIVRVFIVYYCNFLEQMGWDKGERGIYPRRQTERKTQLLTFIKIVRVELLFLNISKARVPLPSFPPSPPSPLPLPTNHPLFTTTHPVNPH
jgi:hypothetical protein